MFYNLLEGINKSFEVGKEENLVVKKFSFQGSPLKILDEIDKYYKNIKAAGINVPFYLEGRISPKKKKIVTKWSESGEPLILRIKSLKKIDVIKTLNQVLNINLWAYNNKLPMDPTLQNFTEKNKNIFYVNFYPPIFSKDILKMKGIEKTILLLILFGFVQKITIPIREYIAFRPELKKDIIRLADIFLYQMGYDEVRKDYHQIFHYKLRKKTNLSDIGSFDGYEKIYYFDPDNKIISFSPKNIWTSHLLYRDLEIINKLNL